MGRILCLIGLHDWREVYRRLSWWDQRTEVYQVRLHCKRCKKVWAYYDTGEE